MNVTLRLQYAQSPQGSAAAWLIPGPRIDDWLEELVQWNVPLLDASLCVLSLASAPGEVTSVLALLSHSSPPRVSPRCQAYRVVAERLFVPVHAQLEPNVSVRELESLFPSPDAHYVWHPTLGFITIERSDWRRVSDLLKAPLLKAVDWSLAQPGIVFNQRLVSIEPLDVPQLDDSFWSGSGDIGQNAEQIGDLPPHPDERGGMGKLRDKLLGGMASAVGKALGSMGAGAAASTGVLAAIKHWAERQLQRANHSLDVERHRALARLLEMLAKDPDQGLRYALPLAGDALSRGIAPPGSQLASRNIDFQLGNLGGGRPVDAWDVGDYRSKLIARYRELANRELSLGRHRRAAYIFAELLGDLRAAAAALQDGGHFREAATLYEQRLNSPQEAARCLVAGQLWAEAIALYEKLGAHEQVGDLYTKLEDHDLAKVAYLAAYDRCYQTGDYVAAARILEHKLQDIDRAYACLCNAWPSTPQAAQALEAAFALLVRAERYEAARELVQAVSQRLPEDRLVLPLVTRLAALASDFPNQSVRKTAADRTRVLVSKRLEQAPLSELSALTTAIARLAPQDRLLALDGQRFTQQATALALPARRPAKAATPAPRLTQREGYHLPSGVAWRTAVAGEHSFYVAGWNGPKLCVLRLNENGDVQTLEPWPILGNRAQDILLAAPYDASHKLLVHGLSEDAIRGEHAFVERAGFHKDHTGAGTHRQFSAHTVGVHYATHGRLNVLDVIDQATLQLNRFTQGGAILADSSEMNFAQVTNHILISPVCSAAHGPDIFFSSGPFLLIGQSLSNMRLEEFPHPITSIATARHASQPRIAVSMTIGAKLLWHERPNSPSETFAHDLHSPRIAISQQGRVIAAAEQGIEVYSTRDAMYRLKLLGRLDTLPAPPLAVIPFRRSDKFAVVLADGRVRIYSL